MKLYPRTDYASKVSGIGSDCAKYGGCPEIDNYYGASVSSQAATAFAILSAPTSLGFSYFTFIRSLPGTDNERFIAQILSY